ncbi:MAG: phosphoribosylglycinamide formyltransferase [Planctomycetaceae bacterium]
MTPPPTALRPLRLAVLISGSGRTLDNLIERIAAGRLAATIDVVVSSRDDVRGVRIAEAAGLPVRVVSPTNVSTAAFSTTTFDICAAAGVDLVVMAGFLQLVAVPPSFAGRVINIHPSLLPAFGGKGFHGMHVHRAVLARGCTVSGCTVHLVDDEYDHGRILLQHAVPVLPDDTPDSLAARVFAAECDVLPEAITHWGRSRRDDPTAAGEATSLPPSNPRDG